MNKKGLSAVVVMLIVVIILLVVGFVWYYETRSNPSPSVASQNSPHIDSLSPSSDLAQSQGGNGSSATVLAPAVQVTIHGNGFTSVGNTVNFAFGPVDNLTSADGQTITFNFSRSADALAQCTGTAMEATFCEDMPVGVYPVSVTNANGTSNQISFNVTSTPISTSGTVSNNAPTTTPTSNFTNNGISFSASPAIIEPQAGDGLGNLGEFSWSNVPAGSSLNIPCVSNVTMKTIPANRDYTCGSPASISSSGSLTLLFGITNGNLNTKIVGQINSGGNSNLATTQINVVPDTQAKTITVSAPGNGTILSLNQPYTIQWQASGYPAGAIINISLNTLTNGASVSSYEFVANVPNTGSYIWTPSAQTSAGIAHATAATTYQIVVNGYLPTTPTAGQYASAGSDYATSGTFTIQ